MAVWVSGPLTDFAIVQVKARSNVGTAVFVICRSLQFLKVILTVWLLFWNSRYTKSWLPPLSSCTIVAILMFAVTLTVPGPVESTCTCAEPVAPRLTVVVALPVAWKTPGPESVSDASVHGEPVIVTVRAVLAHVWRSAPPSIERLAVLFTFA